MSGSTISRQPAPQPPLEQTTVIRSAPRPASAATAAWVPSTQAGRPTADHPPVHWQNWPLRDEPTERALWGAVLATVTLATSSITGSLLATVFAVGVILAATPRVWLPIQYRLDSRGITETMLGQSRLIPWRAIGRYRICRRGLLLYGTRAPSAFDGLGRRYVPWREDPTLLLTALAKRIGPPSQR